MLTSRDFDILRAAARYYVVSRQHIHKLIFTDDTTGRATRRRLMQLSHEDYLNRTLAPVFNRDGGSPWPAYYPSQKGNEALAAHFDDERFLLTPTRSPCPHHLLHWLSITDTHVALDQALAGQTDLKIEDWINEWD